MLLSLVNASLISRFIFQNLLNDFKGHLCNMSFNFETLALDVEPFYALSSSGIVDSYGLYSKDEYCIDNL